MNHSHVSSSSGAADREAALRRRRTARLAALVVALALIALLAFLALLAGGDGDRTEAKPDPQPVPLAACGAQPPSPIAEPKQYEERPETMLEPGVDYRAVIHTSCGDIEIDLLEEKAPIAVNNFVFLAREGFYDGLIWHRVERNAVIQAGDPNGRNGVPPDGPGYTIPDELPERPRAYVYGVVGMANRGPDTAGSQFFIVTHPADQGPAGYRPFYTIFGRVDPNSYETLDAIESVETDIANADPAEAVKPITPIYIGGIDIVEL